MTIERNISNLITTYEECPQCPLIAKAMQGVSKIKDIIDMDLSIANCDYVSVPPPLQFKSLCFAYRTYDRARKN